MSSPATASPEELVREALANNVDVAVIVQARIYPDLLPQLVLLPAIVIRRAETEYINTIHNSIPLGSHAVVESACAAKSRLGAEKLADEVVLALGLAGFEISNRTQDFEEDPLTYITIVSCKITQV